MSQNEEHLPGPAGLSLRTNFAWSFTGNVIYMASQWAMLAVLAKLGSPETVGQFALGLAVTAPIILFTNLQLRAVIATDARNENTFSDYFTLRIATTIFSIFITLGLVFISDYSRQTALVILVIGIAKVFESLSDIIYGLLQQNEQMARIAWSMMIRGPLSLLIMAICMFIWGNILIAVIGLAFVWLMVFLFYDMQSVPWLQKRIHEPINLQINWDGTTQRRLIRLAFPLGLTAMLASLNTNIPRYLLENYFGEGTLGLFTAMAYLLVAGNAVVGALGQSASPRLAKYFASNRKAFQQLLIKLLAIALVLGIAGILLAFFVGSELLTLLYSLEYAQNLDVFLWLCLVATVSYMASFLGYGMTAARSFRVQPFIFLFVSIVTLLSGLYLIPRYGLLGASWVLLIAAVAQAGSALAVNIYALKKASSENFALGG